MAYLLHGLYDWYRDLMDNQSGKFIIYISLLFMFGDTVENF